MARKTFKYRLYPNRSQRERLQKTLDVCRELYNAALQERRDGYRIAKVKLNYYSGGFVSTRDHASALEIQRLGLSLQASTVEQLVSVA